MPKIRKIVKEKKLGTVSHLKKGYAAKGEAP